MLRANAETEHSETNWAPWLHKDIAYPRERKLDIKVGFDRIQQFVSKVELAEALMPVLLAKLEHGNTPHRAHPPLLDPVHGLVALVNRLSDGEYSLETLVTASV